MFFRFRICIFTVPALYYENTKDMIIMLRFVGSPFKLIAILIGIICESFRRSAEGLVMAVEKS